MHSWIAGATALFKLKLITKKEALIFHILLYTVLILCKVNFTLWGKMEAAHLHNVYWFDKLPENVHQSGLVDLRGKCPWLSSRRLYLQVYSHRFCPLVIAKQVKTIRDTLKIFIINYAEWTFHCSWIFAWVNINPVSNVELIEFEFGAKFPGPFGLEQGLTRNSIPRTSSSQA